jgi:two-component system, response regulator
MPFETAAAPPTILIVDDNPIDRILASKAFQRAEIKNPIQELCDGEELMEYLTRQGRFAQAPWPAGPLVILLDINMPKKTGLEALAEIKSNRQLRAIPVIMLTTSDAPSDVALSYELGANSFITKPMNFTEFMKLVRNFAAYWLDSAALPRNASADPH